MTDHIQEFIEAMTQAGCAPSDPSVIMDDDEKRYYHVDGDRRGTKKGSYCLAYEDGFAWGWFMSFKQGGEVHKWHSKSKRKWSAEEKQAHKDRVEATRARREKQRQEAADAARAEGEAIWSAADRTGHSPYAERKGITLRGVRYQGDVLVVPMWRDGEMVAVQQIQPDGFKLFLKGSDHIGAYFSIKGELDTIAICEGVSTGASVAEATGWSVICAFNAGNLKAVARAIRKKYPDARLMIIADNDHEATDAKGQPYNAGIEKAQQAAVAIGGAQVIAPDPEPGLTDWNDVHVKHGIDAVRDGLMSVPVVSAPEPELDDQWEPDYEPDVVEAGGREDPMDQIRPLGHNRGMYYFFPRATGQIMEFSATSLGRPQNLYQLAPRGFWEALYAPETKMGVIADYASAELINACQSKGIFSLEDVRGVGVWKERNGALLVNCGDVIVGEGVKCHPNEFDGEYVYEAGRKVMNLDVMPLGNREAAEFRGICKSLSWKKPQSGDLLAGWIVISAVGGCLNWRSHVFVTGQKSSGKSTVMDKIVTGALRNIGIKLDGGTTEAKIRGDIGASSRPFIMDEAEAESNKAKMQMESILEYFRKANSGGKLGNANGTYNARSAACFGGINPPVHQGADVDRWTLLELVPNRAPDSDVQYKELLERIRALITEDFPDRLLARTVSGLDVLLHNIDVFVDVFSKKLGSKRAGDQIGTLVAGSHALVSQQRVTYDFVEGWVAKQDWEWDDLQGGGSDAEALVAAIMASRVRWDADGMGRESSVGELIWRASEPNAIGHDSAIKGLGGVGIKVDGDRIIISNTARPLGALLRDTPWQSWRRTLSDYDGADNCGGKVVYFAPGLKTKATGIPISALGMDAETAADEFEFEGFE